MYLSFTCIPGDPGLARHAGQPDPRLLDKQERRGREVTPVVAAVRGGLFAAGGRPAHLERRQFRRRSLRSQVPQEDTRDADAQQ